MEFIFDEKKNQKLFKQRGLTFEKVIEAILRAPLIIGDTHNGQ